MSAVLVKYSGDWADEFQCEEFKIFKSREEVESWLDGIARCIKSGTEEFYFGTNEFQSFNDINDLIGRLEVIEITDEEAKVFVKHFGESSFGTSGVFNIDCDDCDFDEDEEDNIEEFNRAAAEFDFLWKEKV